MTTVTARKPTKKAFYFPTTADAKKAQRKAAEAAKALRAQEAEAKLKAKRVKKDKVIRDSFTMPKTDYERIAGLKRKCLDAGVAVKKSELLRAGLQLLDSASSKRLVAALAALETVKTGRPAKGE
jgi:sialic acid synthase SpsE